MNLKPKLRALKNNVKYALRALIGLVQGDSFFADAAGVFNELQLVYEFVSFVLPLATERIGIGPLLDFGAGEAVGHVSRAGCDFGLMNVRAFGGKEPLLVATEIQISLRESHAFY